MLLTGDYLIKVRLSLPYTLPLSLFLQARRYVNGGRNSSTIYCYVPLGICELPKVYLLSLPCQHEQQRARNYKLR